MAVEDETSCLPAALPRAIFFDLDGTLVDSVPDLADAIDGMLHELGFKPAGEARVRLWVGNGARKLVQRALLDAEGIPEFALEKSRWDIAHRLFLHFYGRSAAHKTRVYPQVKETLAYFQSQGVRMAIITNKPQQFTPHLLEALGLADFFELVICGDTLPVQKPDPEAIFHAMEILQLNPADCLMVGDSKNDISAANAAGIRSVCVSYGYNHGEDTQALPATVHITDFGELRRVFA